MSKTKLWAGEHDNGGNDQKQNDASMGFNFRPNNRRRSFQKELSEGVSVDDISGIHKEISQDKTQTSRNP